MEGSRMIEVTDPFKGKKYSETTMARLMSKFPTHPLLKVAGTGKASWDPELERYVV
jgi:hypothetical protein